MQKGIFLAWPCTIFKKMNFMVFLFVFFYVICFNKCKKLKIMQHTHISLIHTHTTITHIYNLHYKHKIIQNLHNTFYTRSK